MDGIFRFAGGHVVFSCIMLVLNCILAGSFLQRAAVYMKSHLYDALGGRTGKRSLYKRSLEKVRQSFHEYEKERKKTGLYGRAKEKMKRSGYGGDYAAAVYLFLKYVLTSVMFAVSFIVNYPRVAGAFALPVLMFAIVECVVAAEGRKHNRVFQKNIYKIYKYLHNQISSGVLATDAVRTVYEVIEDKKLKDILIQLAASYELTLDIDLSLDDFKSNFNSQEAESLCIALKQGVMTGDNRELLARQEEVMFKKYFNYIQAETDSCKTRLTLSVALFTTIVIVMIAVPLLNDATEAVGKIFIN